MKEILNINPKSLVFQMHVQVELALILIEHHVLNCYERRGSIAPRILEISTKCKWLISFTAWPLVRLCAKRWNCLPSWQKLKVFLNFRCHSLTKCIKLIQMWLIHELTTTSNAEQSRMFKEELLADFKFVLTGTMEWLKLLKQSSAWTNACFRGSNIRPLFYEARMLTTHSRYFSLMLRYALTNIIACVLRYFMSIIRYY
jgi:hypothetical protein